MSYILLWLEGQIAALLLIATIAAVAARISRRWLSRTLVAMAIILASLVGIAGVAGSIYLHVKWSIPNDWMGYTVSWLVVLLVGIGLLLWRAGKIKEGTPAATNWPRQRLAVVFAVALMLTCTTYWNIDTAVRLKMASLRQEASTELMSITPPSVPDRENAALVYEKAFLERKRIDKASKGTPKAKRGNGLIWDFFVARNAVNNPELVSYLQEQQPVFVLLKRASAMPACAFDRESEGPGLASMMVDLEPGEMKWSARMLAADACWKASTGKLHEAFEDIAALHGMAAHLGASPTAISGISAQNLESFSTKATQFILTTTTPSRADMEPVSIENPLSYERVLYRSMKGEAAVGLSTIADFADGVLPADIFSILYSNDQNYDDEKKSIVLTTCLLSLWRVFLAEDDITAYRKFNVQMRAAIGQHASGRYYYKQSFKRGLAEAKELQDKLSGMNGIVTKIMVPAWQRISVNMVRGEARQRLVKLALSAAAYRSKNNKWPDKLEELVPEFISAIPTDPFDDKPLCFRVTGNERVLYSVGPTMEDDASSIGNLPHIHLEKSAEKSKPGADSSKILFFLSEEEKAM